MLAPCAETNMLVVLWIRLAQVVLILQSVLLKHNSWFYIYPFGELMKLFALGFIHLNFTNTMFSYTKKFSRWSGFKVS